MDISDYCLLITRTSTGEKKQQGITNFLVDTKLPGIEVRKIATLGQRAIGTTQVFYSGVKVPASALLGEVDRGWEAVDSYLWYERLCLSAARTGAASAAFEYRPRLRQEPQAVRSADRPIPGDLAQARRHEGDARCVAHAGLPLRLAPVATDRRRAATPRC